MLSRIHPALLLAGASAVVIAALAAALVVPGLLSDKRHGTEPLIVQCAASQRGPVAEIAAAYEAETGQPVEVRYGASETILTNVRLSGQGDVFLPADDSYIDEAREKDLIAEVVPVARMNAVLIVPADNPKQIKTWADLFGKKAKIAQAEPDAAAVGKITRAQLRQSGRWDELHQNTFVYKGTVTDVANSVALKTVDAGIVWDVVARPMPQLAILTMPELAKVEARVQIAVLKTSKQPTEALRFVRYLAGSDKGLRTFRDYGFTRVESGDPAVLTPSLLLYAGAMLRPAIEETVKDFERREGVKVMAVFNGCGLLVSAMSTKARPDVFFSCDARFMEQVHDLFDSPQTISTNQLVIAVKKGNPHEVTKLKDLAQPGLKVGVGHEEQCALGAITRETFLQAGVHGAIAKNVVVQSPTGDLLVNQLLVGSLDAAVVYRSNVLEHPAELDWTPVTGIPCASPTQPIAVGKQTTFPNLSRRLVQAIQSAESRRRFEGAGFGWEWKK